MNEVNTRLFGIVRLPVVGEYNSEKINKLELYKVFLA